MQVQISRSEITQVYGEEGALFNDKSEREEFVDLCNRDKGIQTFFRSYCNIPNGSFLKWKTDPLGEKKVDLGLICDGELILLVDVERTRQPHFKKDFPFKNVVGPNKKYYPVVNALKRKDSYFENYDLPYVQWGWNGIMTKGTLITKESIEKSPVQWVNCIGGFEDVMHRVPYGEVYMFGKDITEKEKCRFK